MIRWEVIQAEAKPFREGFVAIFRKYEGHETDERDAYGRPVKVTMASFARHMGIDQKSFHRWCKPPPKKVVTMTTKSAVIGTEKWERWVRTVKSREVLHTLFSIKRTYSILRALELYEEAKRLRWLIGELIERFPEEGEKFTQASQQFMRKLKEAQKKDVERCKESGAA